MLAPFRIRIHGSYVILGVALGVILVVGAVQIWGAEPLSELVSWPWLVVALVLVLVAVIRPSPITLLLAVVAGGLVANYRVSFDLAGRRYLESFTGQTIEISGIIAEDPEASDIGFALRLTNLSISSTLASRDEASAESSERGTGELLGVLYAQVSDSAFGQETPKRSDKITLSGKLNAGFGTFVGTLYRPDVVALERAESGNWLLNLRELFSDATRTAIESPAVDLGLGYVLGIKSALPKELQMTLQAVGLTHIVVASGSNLSILVDFARKRFGKISRFCAFLVASGLVIAFVVMVGFSATMVRAGIVSLLSLVAWYFGRKFLPGRLLLIVAALTLLYSPTYLLDVGWQLSFAAFAGILVIGPKLTRFFYAGGDDRELSTENRHLFEKEKGPNFIAATLIESAAASLLCLPILVYTFGQFSLVSLVANLLILPTIPYAMGLTFLTGVLALVKIPFLTNLCAGVASVILNFHIAVVNFFGEQTMFLVTVESGNPMVFWFFAPIIVMIMIGMMRKLWRRRKFRKKLQEYCYIIN